MWNLLVSGPLWIQFDDVVVLVAECLALFSLLCFLAVLVYKYLVN